MFETFYYCCLLINNVQGSVYKRKVVSLSIAELKNREK